LSTYNSMGVLLRVLGDTLEGLGSRKQEEFQMKMTFL
jgi:hypothetical protein